MKNAGMAGYALAALVAGIALFNPGRITNARVRLGLEQPGEEHVKERRWAQERSDAMEPDGAAIFLGDSITDAMPVDAVAPYAVNYGIQWQTSEQLLESMKGYGSLKRARVIFLNIGTNDILRGVGLAQLRGRLQLVVGALPPDRPLVWSGILPGKPENAAAIRGANAIVHELCAARGHCAYVDTWAFMTRDGHQVPGYFSDQVHPTPAGYAPWVGELRRVALLDAAATSEHNGPH